MEELIDLLELRDREVLLILDYDGTLTEIVQNPMDARLTKERKKILESLNSKEKINILINSGRPIEELVEITGNINIDLLGNHGLFFKSKSSQDYSLTIEGQQLQLWDEQMLTMKQYLQKEILKKYPKLWLQENKHGFVLHTRQMKPSDKNMFLFEIDSLLKDKFNDISYSTGKEIIEVKPTKVINKGKGIKWYIEAKYSPKTADYSTIVVGDDVTDEDMFVFVNKRKNGISIKIGNEKASNDSKTSAARVVFNTIEKLFLFLDELDKLS